MGPRRLTLLRHGEAQNIDTCAEDFDRVLTRRGVAEATEMADRLVHRGLQPDLILCSPAERAWATAQIVATACELEEKQVQCARELYLAPPEITWRIVTACAADFQHVLVCGHNPGLSEVASRLGPTPANRELTTAGLATALWQAADWSALRPELASLCDVDDPNQPEDS